VPRLPTAYLSDLFPGIEVTQATIPAGEFARDRGFLPLHELLTLAAICSFVRPQRVFEIGTYRGSTSLVMAMHTGAAAEIFTLDLPPQHRATRYSIDNGDITGKTFVVGERYRETPFASKIQQLYGDSARFDFEPYRGAIDLVFVDGNHMYENVKVDSDSAFKILRPGGIIVWDDYSAESGPGVVRALHEFAGRGLRTIAATRFAIHVNRHPPIGQA